MAKRFKMSRRQSKRNFKRYSNKSHKKNLRIKPMRGGYRL